MNTAQQDHFNKYEALANKLGWDALHALVPFPIETIADWIDKGDQYLNTAGNRPWDRASLNFPGKVPLRAMGNIFARLNITQRDRTLPWHKRTGLSLAERNCVLKHVARVEAEIVK